ncbi:hypothetical protein ACFC9R_07460 [Enterococcus casseliflavus]
MLKTNTSSTFTGQVMVGEQMAVYMTASIDTDQGLASSPSISIQDPELYLKNKKKCREGINEYLVKLWAVEDKE